MSLGTLFADYNPRHSKYQIENFIIGINGRTQYGRYRQALRELYPRYRNIKNKISNILDLELQIEEWQPEQDETTTKFKLKESQKVVLMASLADARAALAQMLTEFKHFYSIATQIKDEIGDISGQVDQLEGEYWVQTFKEKIALELFANGRLSQGVLETILAMPERTEMLDFITSINSSNQALSFLKSLPVAGYTAGALITDEEAMTIINGTDILVLEE